VIDGSRVARAAGMAGRVNTIMQTCFFAISGVLPPEAAVAAIKHSIQETYGRRGEPVAQRNFAAVDAALAHLHEVLVPAAATPTVARRPPVPAGAPAFVREVAARVIAGEGDLLPVSARPPDGTYPSGTARWEKRDIAAEIPAWDAALCIQCGKCVLVCPHAVIRAKVCAPAALQGAPAGFPSAPARWREAGDARYTLQVSPEDCLTCPRATSAWRSSPLVASASPLGESLDNIRRLEDAGAAAVVLPSLFEEQIDLEAHHLDRHLSHGAESYAEAVSYFPDLRGYNLGPEGYLEHVGRARAAVGIPVIASLNGVSTGGWTRFARDIEQAGASALELNIFHVPTDPAVTAAEVEQMYVDLVRDVRRTVAIPVAVKVGHAFTAMANVARRLDDAGADGLVLFNRFYLPDFDLEALDVVPTLTLSSPPELLVRLHWVAILSGHLRADLAVTGGAHGPTDVLKAMMAGARVAMLTSALLRHGIDHLSRVRSGLLDWMEAHEYESIAQMQGSMSYRLVVDPTAFERANYMKVLSSYALRR
jgi:dihydroorotate dehydrogenase (fumarate)